MSSAKSVPSTAKKIEAAEEAYAEPLQAVSLVQSLITLRANHSPALTQMFHLGHPKTSDASLIGSVMPFLISPSATATERREARKLQERVLETQLRWPDLAAVSDRCFLICADSFADIGLATQIYTGASRDLKDWPEFAELFSEMVRITSGGQIAQWRGQLEAQNSALVTVLYELFKNTHDHARHEINGAEVPQSIRAIYAQFHSRQKLERLGAQYSKDDVPSDPSLAYAIGAIKEQRTSIGSNPGLGAEGVLELSVIDSGPGMVARWAKRPAEDLSPLEQMRNVLSCFAVGQTSTSSSTRGFGLWKVLRSIEEVRGFIAVRTNGVHAYRRFDTKIFKGSKQMPLKGGGSLPHESLLDWTAGFSPRPAVHPPIRGTLVSMLLPITA